MSFILNLPPSMLAKQSASAPTEEDGEEGAEVGEKKKTREDWKKLKELEELRKLGSAPAMKDEEGKDINPHIPQYVMQAPWYLGITHATLKHQRLMTDQMPEFSKMNEWYKKGVVKGSTATKFRKGACENCGAITHMKKDCLERPRKIGVKYTGEDFAPDEHIQPQLNFDFDGKRDQWNGVNIDLHQKMLKSDFGRIEEAKQALKAQKLDDTATSSDAHDELKYAEDIDMPGQKFETKQRITVRNLRIREDTAKYLHNLDVNSSYYDPKTRSMRGNPLDKEESQFMGDNFVRVSGDAHEFAKKQMFAWEAYERGADVHLQADPTKTELLVKEVHNKKESLVTEEKDSILAKYGGEEHLKAPPRQLLLAQTEDYVEYSRTGAIIKGQQKQSIQSRYEEDVYPSNHTERLLPITETITESTTEDSERLLPIRETITEPTTEDYVTDWVERLLPITETITEPITEDSPTQQKTISKSEKKRKTSEKKRRKKSKDSSSSSSPSSSSSSSSSDSETEESKKERKLKRALKRETQRVKDVDAMLAMDERKRPYNSLYETAAPTEEELEAFRMKRLRTDDPMAAFINK